MITYLVDAVGIYFLIGIVWVCALMLKWHLINEHNRANPVVLYLKALGLLVGWFPWCCYLVYSCLTKKKGP